jgi:hypothetical protein
MATEGQSCPNSAPANNPTKIHPVSERRDVAYAAINRIATQRKIAGTSTGSDTKLQLARSDAAIASVAADTSAIKNLFFIGPQSSFSLAANGMLDAAACQCPSVDHPSMLHPHKLLTPRG